MKPRHAIALALVGWYLMVVPKTTNAQASPTSTPSQHPAKAAIAANAWVLKVPHVQYVTPVLMRAPGPVSSTPFWGIGVFVDKSENVREVEGKVPPQLDGVSDFVRVVPVVVWCLSVVEGMNVAKECSECLSVRLGKEVAKDCSKWCAVTLEEEAHSCEKEFKTKAQCKLGAAKYVKDWYVDADKNGDVVGIAPTVHCWEITDPVPSHWDPITEKAVPDNQYDTRDFKPGHSTPNKDSAGQSRALARYRLQCYKHSSVLSRSRATGDGV
jgi:hypothetical protein